MEATSWGRMNVEDVAATFRRFADHYEAAGPHSATQRLSLRDFQRLIGSLLEGLSEPEGIDLLHQLRVGSKEDNRREEHVVTKHLRTQSARNGVAAPPETPADDEPAALIRKRPVSMASMRREEALQASHILRLKSEVKHCFDALSYDDIEHALGQIPPPPVYEKVAAPVCLMLQIPAARYGGTGLEHWDGLKQVGDACLRAQ